MLGITSTKLFAKIPELEITASYFPDTKFQFDNKILVMTDRKEMTEKLWNALSAPRITWSTSKKNRDVMFNEFETKRVLVAPNQLIAEWYDNPWIDMVVVAFSWRTEPRLVQSIWRSVRQQDWKKHIYIYDVYDNAGIMKNQFRSRKKFMKNILLF